MPKGLFTSLIGIKSSNSILLHLKKIVPDCIFKLKHPKEISTDRHYLSVLGKRGQKFCNVYKQYVSLRCGLLFVI